MNYFSNRPYYRSVSNPEAWQQPDYFSLKKLKLKKLLPANWFPDHTVMGKILNVTDPVGRALEVKAIKAEKDTAQTLNKEYKNALTESENKVAQAVQTQKNTVAQAAEGDRKQNMMLILMAVAAIGVGILFIFKKK